MAFEISQFPIIDQTKNIRTIAYVPYEQLCSITSLENSFSLYFGETTKAFEQFACEGMNTPIEEIERLPKKVISTLIQQIRDLYITPCIKIKLETGQGETELTITGMNFVLNYGVFKIVDRLCEVYNKEKLKQPLADLFLFYVFSLYRDVIAKNNSQTAEIYKNTFKQAFPYFLEKMNELNKIDLIFQNDIVAAICMECPTELKKIQQVEHGIELFYVSIKNSTQKHPISETTIDFFNNYTLSKYQGAEAFMYFINALPDQNSANSFLEAIHEMNKHSKKIQPKKIADWILNQPTICIEFFVNQTLRQAEDPKNSVYNDIRRTVLFLIIKEGYYFNNEMIDKQKKEFIKLKFSDPSLIKEIHKKISIRNTTLAESFLSDITQIIPSLIPKELRPAPIPARAEPTKSYKTKQQHPAPAKKTPEVQPIKVNPPKIKAIEQQPSPKGKGKEKELPTKISSPISQSSPSNSAKNNSAKKGKEKEIPEKKISQSNLKPQGRTQEKLKTALNQAKKVISDASKWATKTTLRTFSGTLGLRREITYASAVSPNFPQPQEPQTLKPLHATAPSDIPQANEGFICGDSPLSSSEPDFIPESRHQKEKESLSTPLWMSRSFTIDPIIEFLNNYFSSEDYKYLLDIYNNNSRTQEAKVILLLSLINQLNISIDIIEKYLYSSNLDVNAILIYFSTSSQDTSISIGDIKALLFSNQLPEPFLEALKSALIFVKLDSADDAKIALYPMIAHIFQDYNFIHLANICNFLSIESIDQSKSIFSDFSAVISEDQLPLVNTLIDNNRLCLLGSRLMEAHQYGIISERKLLLELCEYLHVIEDLYKSHWTGERAIVFFSAVFGALANLLLNFHFIIPAIAENNKVGYEFCKKCSCLMMQFSGLQKLDMINALYLASHFAYNNAFCEQSNKLGLHIPAFTAHSEAFNQLCRHDMWSNTHLLQMRNFGKNHAIMAAAVCFNDPGDFFEQVIKPEVSYMQRVKLH